MLDITQLNCSLSTQATGESSRRGTHLELDLPAGSLTGPGEASSRPVVTWRITRSCNLNCLNCVSDSRPRRYGSELTTSEGMALISDLAAYEVPRLILAGGEPLLRRDLVKLVAYASGMGIQTSVFSNGTLVSPAQAAELKRAGLHSVSILLEGVGREVDRQRGAPGAFDAVLDGYANCEAAGLETEVRIPLRRGNYAELAGILDLIERQHIRRAVFAHLVYAGRGNSLEDDLAPEQKRRALDVIFEREQDSRRRGVAINIATVENHADGIYLYLRLARRNPRRAAAVYQWLEAWGGGLRGAGVGLAGIDSVGNVHPDPYWDKCLLGNVRETRFSEIWEKSSDPLLRGLRDRLPLLKGRCAKCHWKLVCGGNLRVRAQEAFGDPWMSDPACYLTNEEISKEVTEQIEAMEDDVLLLQQAA